MRRSQSGAVQVSLVLVLLLALVGAYFFYALYPAFLDEITVRQELHAVVNEGWHRQGREELHRMTMERLGRIGFHFEAPEEGPPVQVRGLGVPEADVEVTCTDRVQNCTEADGKVYIEVRYQRVMPLPWWTGKSVTLKFSPHAEATLNVVNW